MRILPRHLRDLMQVSEVAVIHKTLAGTPPMAANIEFLSVLKHWPLYGATVYEVTVSKILISDYIIEYIYQNTRLTRKPKQ